MTDERIDIVIEDKISPQIAPGIKAIASSAREAGKAIATLQQQIASVNTSAVDQLATALGKALNAQTRQISAQARLISANVRMQAVTDKAAIAQQRLAKETANAAAAQERLAQQTIKTQQVQSRAKNVSASVGTLSSGLDTQFGIGQAVSRERARDIAEYGRELNKLERDASKMGKTATEVATQIDRIGTAQRLGAIDAAQASNLQTNAIQRLKESYDPLFAAQQRYKTALLEIAAAERLGALSSDAANSARLRQQQILAESQRALTSGSRSLRMNIQQSQNIVYQLNDIVVGLASGQAPLTVLIQQGSQLSTVFGPGNGVLGTFKMLGVAIAGILRPFLPFAIAIGAVSLAIKGMNTEARRFGDSKLHAEFDKYAKSAEEAEAITVRFSDTFKAFFSVIYDRLSASTLGRVTGSIVDTLKEWVGTVIDVIRQIPGAIYTIFVGSLRSIVAIYRQIPAIFAEIFTDAFNGIIRIEEAAINKLIAGVNKLRSAFGKDSIGSVSLQSMLKPEFEAGDISTVISKAYEDTMREALEAEKQFSADVVNRSYQNARKHYEKVYASQIKAAKEEADSAAKKLQEGLDNLLTDQLEEYTSRGLNDMELAVAKVGEQVDSLTKGTIKLTEAQKKQIELTKQLAAENVAYKKLQDLVEDTLTPMEEYGQKLKEIQDLQPFAKTPEQVEAISRAITKLNDDTNESAQIFKDFASDIGGALTDAFTNVFKGSKDGFKGMVDDFYNTFARMLARLAVLALAKPIIVPMITSVGSSLGLSDAALQSVGKEFGLGDLSSAASLGKSVGGASGLSTLFAGSGAIGGFSGVNQFGASYLGTGLPGLSGATTASLSGILAGGGVGSFAANLAGFSTGNQFADLGVGTVGAYGGSALASAAGLGAFAGPAGIAAATAAVILASVLSDKKKSSKVQGGTLDFSTGQLVDRGGFTGSKFSQQNYDAVTQIGSLVGSLADSLGVDKKAAGSNLRIEASDFGPNYAFLGQDYKRFSDIGSFLKSITTDLNDLAPVMNKNLKTAIDKIDFSDFTNRAEEIMSDINFAINFDKLGEAPETVSQFESALDELNTTFDTAKITAKRLGLEEAKVDEGRKKAIARLNKDFLDQFRNSNISSQLSSYEAFLALEQQHEQNLKDAASLGVSTSQIEYNYQLQIQTLLAQNVSSSTTLLEQEQERLSTAQELASRYGQITETFDDLLYQLQYGQYTSNDPVTNVTELRQLVESVGMQARLGDADAQERLAQILPDFIRLSEEVYGSNAQFGDDLSLANDLAQDTRTVAQRQLDIQTQIAADSATQVELLSQLANQGGLTGTNEKYYTGEFASSSFAESNPNRILLRAVEAGVVNMTQAEALQRASGFYGTFGEGRAGQFFADNPQAAQTLLAALQAAGLAGYASGGLITGGVRGRDSVPIRAMPGEYVLRESAVSALGLGSVSYMNKTGRMPTGSDSGSDQLTTLNDNVISLTNVVAMMGDRLIELQERTAKASEATASDGKLARWS